MDAPWSLILTGAITAAGGFYAKRLLVWLHPSRRTTPGASSSSSSSKLPPRLDDELAVIHERITDRFGEQSRQMEAGFSRIESALTDHVQVAFPRLQRRVSELAGALEDHAGRDHDFLDARLQKLEKRAS